MNNVKISYTAADRLLKAVFSDWDENTGTHWPSFNEGIDSTISILEDIRKRHPEFTFEEIIEWFHSDHFYK